MTDPLNIILYIIYKSI